MTADIEEIEYAAAIKALQARYAWQFKDLFPFGFAIGPGWLPEVEAVCQVVEQILDDPRDRTIFSWQQIKEKFGEIRMFGRYQIRVPLTPAVLDDEGERKELLRALEQFIEPGYLLQDDDGEIWLTVSDKKRDAVVARVEVAAARCWTICEICGQPGELVKTGWLRVRCPNCVADRIEPMDDKTHAD